MEEKIKKYFCPYCKNKSEKCIRIKIVRENNIITYKCLNYKKK